MSDLEDDLELWAAIDFAAAELKEHYGDEWPQARRRLAKEFEANPPSEEEFRIVLRRLLAREPMLRENTHSDAGGDAQA